MFTSIQNMCQSIQRKGDTHKPFTWLRRNGKLLYCLNFRFGKINSDINDCDIV